MFLLYKSCTENWQLKDCEEKKGSNKAVVSVFHVYGIYVLCIC